MTLLFICLTHVGAWKKYQSFEKQLGTLKKIFETTKPDRSAFNFGLNAGVFAYLNISSGNVLFLLNSLSGSLSHPFNYSLINSFIYSPSFTHSFTYFTRCSKSSAAKIKSFNNVIKQSKLKASSALVIPEA